MPRRKVLTMLGWAKGVERASWRGEHTWAGYRGIIASYLADEGKKAL